MGALEGFSFRAAMARLMGLGTARDLWKAFGYPHALSVENYRRAYERGGIAHRIVRAYPDACWCDGAVPRDDAGAGTIAGEDGHSRFAGEFYTLQRRMRVFHHLERADRLARLGQFSVLVLGFSDGQRTPLDKPMMGQAPLAYLAPYAQRNVTITQWDSDPTSSRFGLPVLYRVQTGDQRKESIGQTEPNRAFTVHHSRVLHVVEGKDESDVFGVPALRAVWNYLLDLEKLNGASAETFWLNARGGLAIEAASDASITTEGLAAMKEQAQEYEDQLRRILAFQGAQVKMLTSNVASPQYQAELLQALIAGTTGIPQRIIFGSERGELASTQDENSWEARVDERRSQHCGPELLEPFVLRMIETGNLPAPVGDWWVDWPEASAASPEKEADIALKRAQAIATYANSAADQIVIPEEFRPWLGLESVPPGGFVVEDADEPLVEDVQDD